LVPTQHKDLLKIPRSKYRPLNEECFEQVQAYRTRREVFRQERTIVVTFNEDLFDAQVRGLGWQLQKKRKELRQLKTRLARRASGKVKRGRKPTLASVQRQVDKILSWQYHSELFNVKVHTQNNHIVLQFGTNINAVARLHRRQFGKTIHFTDNHHWTNEEIVAAYRGQCKIEDAFKQMKQPVFVSWKPRFHWTDQKMRVHAFYCVLALAISSLLQRELAGKGLKISIPKMLENLSSIKEVAICYPKNKVSGPPVSLALSDMDSLQKKLYRLLGLKDYRDS